MDPRRPGPGPGGGGSIAPRRGFPAGEALAWAAAAALVSPLAVYAGRPEVPLAALWAVASGIALSLALAGRRLHAVLLQDALSGRGGAGRAALAAGMTLLVFVLVLVGAALAVLMVFARRDAGTVALPWGAG